MSARGTQIFRARERVPTGRRGRPSKSMIAAAMERPFCAYLHKVCLNNRLEGHKYCIDHIMNDKTAPYRQCTFIHPTTGRRCPRAAHKVDRRSSPLCGYHKALVSNAPPQHQQDQIKDPRQTLLDDLQHRKQADGTQNETSNNYWIPDPSGTAAPSQKLINVIRNFNNNRSRQEESIEAPTVEEIAARHNQADSDDESVDNCYDLFRNASYYTEEEILRTLRDKMIRLRRLYIEQFSHIQYILKEKRLKFIQSQRTEDEIYGDTYSFRNYPNSPDYEILLATLNYQKTFGPYSLLEDKARTERLSRPPTVGPHHHPRTISDGSATNANTTSTNLGESALASTSRDGSASQSLCIISKTPNGCDKQRLPLSPYCRQHILYDNKQVLFRPCAGGMPPCLTPVASYNRKNNCWLHTAIN